MKLISDDELYHHGIKGQKWGLRKYQNEDGSLTEAGKKRYGYDLDISDTNRTNVAKIRKGEAQRRLDNAKANNSSKDRQAQLRKNVKTANKTIKEAKKFDKGASLAAEGKSISSNNRKRVIAGAALVALDVGSTVAIKAAYNSGKLSAGAATALNAAKNVSVVTAAAAYGSHLSAQDSALRAYSQGRSSGRGTIKRTGGEEYQYRKSTGNKYSKD